MSTLIDTLPVILVSAANEFDAATLISELIDTDITDDYLKDKQSPDRVWRLVNKYYSANVRVHPLTDNGQLKVDVDSIEAHIIYLNKEEVSEEEGGVTAASRRAVAAADAWRRAHVRLLLLEAAAAGARLAAWAAAARAHLVPLREPPDPPEPHEPHESHESPGPHEAGRWRDACGAARARQALHAHVWRGLQRTDRAPRPPRPADESSSSSCAGTDDEEAAELRAVEHAEAFAAALGTLGPALASREQAPASREQAPASREQAPASREQAGSEPRHDRAEALVAAFCRALGYDLDAC